MGALNNFQFTGQDFFADKDICSIVLEVPNSVLGAKEIGLWARTLIAVDGASGSWVQTDRGARPSQTPFLAGEQIAVRTYPISRQFPIRDYSHEGISGVVAEFAAIVRV